MNKTLLLASVIFKNNSNFFAQFGNTQNNKKKGKIAAIVLVAAFIFIGISIYSLSYSLFSVGLLDAEGNPSPLDTIYIKNLLTVLIPYISLFLFLFLNSLVVSIFFLSNDSHIYLALPLKPYQIFLARLISTLLSSYIIEFVLLFPIFLSFNIVTNASLLIYINEVLLFLSLPLLPIAFTFILTTIIDLVLHIQKHREAFSFVYSIMMIVGIVGLELIMQFALPDENFKENVAVIGQIKTLIKNQAEALSFLDFINQFVVKGFISNHFDGFLNILIFVLISFSVTCLVSFISNIFYQKSIMGEGESSKKNHANRKIKDVQRHSSFYSYCLKEWKLLFRSPSACIQIIFPPFLVIILLIISIIVTYSKNQETMKELSTTIAAFKDIISLANPVAPFIICIGSAFFSTLLVSSASAISREGKSAYLLKVLPISPMKQIHAKMSVGVLFTSLLTLLILIGGTIFLKLPWYLPFVYFPLSFLTILLFNYIMIQMDLNHPYLDWENETAAIKQNRAVLFTILILFAIMIGFVLIGLLFYILSIPGYVALIIMTCLTLLFSFLIEKKMQKKEASLFIHLES